MSYIIINRHDTDKEAHAIGPFEMRGFALNWIDNKLFTIREDHEPSEDFDHWEESVHMDQGCLCVVMREVTSTKSSSRVAFYMIMEVINEQP